MAYPYFDAIMGIPIRLYPTAAHAQADGINSQVEIPDSATDVRISTPKRLAFIRRKSKRHSETELVALVKSVFGEDVEQV